MAGNTHLRYLGTSDYFEDTESGTVWEKGGVATVTKEIAERVMAMPGENFEKLDKAPSDDEKDFDPADARAMGAALDSVEPTDTVSNTAPGSVEAARHAESPPNEESR